MNGQSSSFLHPRGICIWKRVRAKHTEVMMPSPDCISVLSFAVQAEQTWFQAALIRLGVKKNKQQIEDA